MLAVGGIARLAGWLAGGGGGGFEKSNFRGSAPAGSRVSPASQEKVYT